ncbi:hypothetical protein [Planktothricoides raciborskii]|uniref:hypothetical protein n=1 Tax=Planktothricoides raciborskii TaxID=132608 RepID=UPI0016827506|nr:hypothetical protein [Planktothricoides raciborskii]MBD2582536.1 hypothetical protein [Planktothricoides raciborskii FACHB-1261]
MRHKLSEKPGFFGSDLLGGEGAIAAPKARISVKINFRTYAEYLSVNILRGIL